MGSFFGHALPGTFFILIGLWWSVRIFQRYFNSLCKNRGPFVSSVTFPIRCSSRRCTSLDIEAITVVAMCVVGILVEVVIGPLVRDSGHVGMPNLQHGTMYFFFGSVGVVALVNKRLTLIAPRGDDILYVTLTLAYLTEAVLFRFHLFGRQDVDVLLHTLLLYTIYGAMVATIAEMAYKHNMLVAQCRAFFTILQGTWFWQAGFYLYNPFRGEAWHGRYDHGHGVEPTDMSTSKELHGTMMFMTCSFAWHMGAIFVLLLVIAGVVGHVCRRGSRGDVVHEVKLLPHTYTSVPADDTDNEAESLYPPNHVKIKMENGVA